jgi:hypothetical protein
MNFIVYFAKNGEMSRIALSHILALHAFIAIVCSAMVRSAESGLSLYIYYGSMLTAALFCLWIAVLLADSSPSTKKKRSKENTRAQFAQACAGVAWVWLCMVASTVSGLIEKIV